MTEVVSITGQFFWTGWSEGADCEPPEPGKRWLTIHDGDGEEFAVIVHRLQENPPSATDEARMLVKEGNAQIIVDALNSGSWWKQ